MAEISIVIDEEPHGHGLSFKKGLADGLLESNQHEDTVPATHKASYRRGFSVGESLKESIAQLIKP